MTLAEKLAGVVEDAENDPRYWRDVAATDFTRELHDRMKKFKISQGQLARRMGTSRPYVTKLLSGSNFTLHTMAKLALALDAVVRIRLEGTGERSALARHLSESSSGGETTLSMAKHLEGRQRVVTTMDSSSELLVADRRR